jgi:hypothetical protein
MNEPEFKEKSNFSSGFLAIEHHHAIGSQFVGQKLPTNTCNRVQNNRIQIDHT